MLKPGNGVVVTLVLVKECLEVMFSAKMDKNNVGINLADKLVSKLPNLDLHKNSAARTKINAILKFIHVEEHPNVMSKFDILTGV